jgi:hypothetical protein
MVASDGKFAVGDQAGTDVWFAYALTSEKDGSLYIGMDFQCRAARHGAQSGLQRFNEIAEAV